MTQYFNWSEEWKTLGVGSSPTLSLNYYKCTEKKIIDCQEQTNILQERHKYNKDRNLA